MKREIFGRKSGSNDHFKLMLSSDGATAGGSYIASGRLREFEIDNTRRAVKALRDKAVEGYVLFEGDTTRYVFTPSTDFIYPATP